MEPIKFHVRKNDMVLVVAGKEKGKSGKILRVLPKKNRVIVEKVNFVKRHSRPSGKTRQGELFRKKPRFISPMFCYYVPSATKVCGRGSDYWKTRKRPWCAKSVAS